MSRPTKQTITSMTAASGSSTHPRSTVDVPKRSHVKLTTARGAIPLDQRLTTFTKAASEINKEMESEPMASAAADLRRCCFRNAITPDATMGTAGISQRTPVMAEAVSCGVSTACSCIRPSPLHPVHLVEIGCIGVAIDGDHQAQAHGGFGRGHGDGEDGKHHPGEQFGMRTVAPERDQIEVRGVQHEFDADEHE